jgi:hypothetical protein
MDGTDGYPGDDPGNECSIHYFMTLCDCPPGT